MGAGRRLTPQRLRTIMQRQADPGWGSDYQPAIRAVRGEAPKISHAITLNTTKIPGRKIHVLSLSELAAALLGLHNPAVIGLQEQRAIWGDPRPHPLHNLPGVVVGELVPLKGIIDVAERLGYIKYLPKLFVPDPEIGRRDVVFPFVGDLLWAVCSIDSKFYCINWTVKDSELDFKRPLLDDGFGKRSEARSEKLRVRHELESTFYADAVIRTVPIAGTLIDRNVRANLRVASYYLFRDQPISDDERIEILSEFRHCIDIQVPPSELIVRLSDAGKYSLENYKTLLWQAIWYRMLRVDLFRPIEINKPLHPEVQDVLIKYADWFSESPC